MTQNQLRYWELQETKRANRTKEAENERSNKASESIGKYNAEVNRWNALNAEKQAEASSRQASAAQTNASANYLNAQANQEMLPYKKAESIGNIAGSALKAAATIGGWIAAFA